MLAINKIHHIAIICSDYQASKRFYCEVLGFNLISEVYREERDSWKADLALHDQYTIELFSFPSPVPRPSRQRPVVYVIWLSRLMILIWR